MGSRLRQSILLKYQKAVDSAREALASDITVYYKTGNKIVGSGSWDPINQEAVDVNLADGNYYWDEITTKTIKASTSRLGLTDKFMPIQLAGGQINRNDVIISCKLSDVLLDPLVVSGETIFHKATKIDINGDFCIPRTSVLKYGLGGNLYSCALVATFDTIAN